MRAAIDDGELASVDKIQIAFGGDTERETFIEALEFALDVLKQNNGCEFDEFDVVEID